MTKGSSGAGKSRRSATGSPRPAAGEVGADATEAAPDATDAAPPVPASRLIDARIRDLGGGRGETLARLRALILEADPAIIEEVKWMGTPVWSRHGIICTGEAYAKVVKLTFARGASTPDPTGLFNASLAGC